MSLDFFISLQRFFDFLFHFQKLFVDILSNWSLLYLCKFVMNCSRQIGRLWGPNGLSSFSIFGSRLLLYICYYFTLTVRPTLTKISIDMFALLVSVLIEVRISRCFGWCFFWRLLFLLSSLFLLAPLSQFLRYVGKVTSGLPSVIFVTIPLPLDEIECPF